MSSKTDEADSPMLQYFTDRTITPHQFKDVLVRSTLAERRPVHDAKVINAMLTHADILATAWAGDELVGVSRSVTDFEYCCYLSDLAVDVRYQKQGVGRRLIQLTRSCLGTQANLILLAAPAADEYYGRIGFTRHSRAWILAPGTPF